MSTEGSWENQSLCPSSAVAPAGGRKRAVLFFSVFMPYSDNFLFSYTSESLFFFFFFRIPSSEEVFRPSPSPRARLAAAAAAEGLPTPRPSSSLVVFGFGVCEDVRLEVGGLRELLVAAVEGADVGPVAGVDPHVRAQVKVQGEALPAALEGTLEVEEEEDESAGGGTKSVQPTRSVRGSRFPPISMRWQTAIGLVVL